MSVRVRFAPSPTGDIHIGNVRAAVFNVLFARKHDGTFILRIEDTDRARSTEESAEGIMRDLRWLGLDYQEGPDTEKKPYGPYHQMDRLDDYQARAEELVESGHAYPCFCGPTQGDAEDDDEVEGYDRSATCTCDRLPAEEVEERRRQPHAIRFRGGGERVSFEDIVFGEQATEVEDFIILKSDGIPTYHFGVVCDDHAMEVTHVIRGRDHLTNTAKHVALYDAFGWEPPAHCHFGLTLGLSKRDASVSIRHLREKGYVPEAILNCALLLGWSPGGEEEEFFDPWSVVDDFELGDLKKAESNFDRDKFEWLAGEWIRKGISMSRLAALARPRLEEKGWLPDDEELLPRQLEAIRSHLLCADDVVGFIEPFHVLHPFEEEVEDDLSLDSAEPVLETLRDHIEGMGEVTADAFSDLSSTLKEESGHGGGDLWRPIRGALWSRAQGPQLPLVAAGLGREECLRRIDRALDWVRSRG